MTTRKDTAKKWTLIVLVVFILIAIIGGTYSRYSSSKTGNGEVDIAKWAVTINDADMTDDTVDLTVTFEEVENDDVVDGKIAPATQMYAEFVIDPDGSEVAVDYEFELGDIQISGDPNADIPSGLAVSRVVNVDTGATISESNGVYSGTIELEDQDTPLSSNEAVTVRVYIEWENDENNNEEDTGFGIDAPTLEMEITGTAKQHITVNNP